MNLQLGWEWVILVLHVLHHEVICVTQLTEVLLNLATQHAVLRDEQLQHAQSTVELSLK